MVLFVCFSLILIQWSWSICCPIILWQHIVTFRHTWWGPQEGLSKAIYIDDPTNSSESHQRLLACSPSLFSSSLDSAPLSQTWPWLLTSFPHDSVQTLPKPLPSPLWGFASGQMALVPGQPLIFLPGILHCHICQFEVSDPVWLLFWATGPLPKTAS